MSLQKTKDLVTMILVSIFGVRAVVFFDKSLSNTRVVRLTKEEYLIVKEQLQQLGHD